MKPIWKASNIGKGGRVTKELRPGFLALTFCETPQLVHVTSEFNPWFDLQRGCLAVSFRKKNVFLQLRKKFSFRYSTFQQNKNKKGSEIMNAETNLPTVESTATSPKLTPGGGEIISSETAFVQTEAEVGPEVVAQEGNA